MPLNLPPIDDVQTPIGQALSECEVYCVAACCGMDAYQIESTNLQRWANTVRSSIFETVKNLIDDAIQELQFAPESFYFLDADHSREEVLAWFRQIQAAFGSVRYPER